MKPVAQADVLAGLSPFEKTCVYCGARFRVLASVSPDAQPARTYDCPGCGKDYELEAMAMPVVQLLRGRTDGKSDRYQETMF